jgi:diaminopimelate decarboxylase
VEEKGGTLFVGVDAGFNLSNLHAYYQYPYIVAPLLESETPRRQVTIAGNINEGIDTLAEGIELPLPREGDLLAIMNLGGYSASSASNHCMRGDYQEILVAGNR